MKACLRLVGLEIGRYYPPARPPIIELLDLYKVDVIFDVGANIGQSGAQFRAMGFKRTIVSFEPVTRLFEELQRRAAGDDSWYVERLALGDTAQRSEIHVSGGHAGASSILEMTENVSANAPDQCVVATEAIDVETLDAMMEKHYPSGDRCFLKLDVQGYEARVLAGGSRSLDRIVGLKVEMSLVENYVGEALLPVMIRTLYALGFRLIYFENGWSDAVSREAYQVDGVFFRTGAAGSPGSRLPVVEATD